MAKLCFGIFSFEVRNISRIFFKTMLSKKEWNDKIYFNFGLNKKWHNNKKIDSERRFSHLTESIEQSVELIK